MSLHMIWQKIRRPFIHPFCVKECQWEVYDVTAAGCLLCGTAHVCQKFACDNKCPLVETEDCSQVCSITGWILPSVRYSKEEYYDNICMKPENHVIPIDWDQEVGKYIDKILDSTLSRKCREEENKTQIKKLHKAFIKTIRQFKLANYNKLPNICELLTTMIHQEKRIFFIHEVSPQLKQKCHQNILLCILDLKSKGYKICPGNKLQDLVCGLIYLLRSGISYRNYELLPAIPEIAQCLPIESRLKLYFNISSKVITSVENEVKLAYRDFHQK